MKVITILITAGLMFTAAGQSTSDDSKKSETKKKVTKAPESPKIPPDATELPDGSFRYVDKNGKKWIYRNTPFGVSKAEEHPPLPAPKIEDDPVKSEDLGDSVRFTRPTPFGPKVWTRKKADFDAYEKSVWERDSKKKDSDAANQVPSKQD